MTVRVLIADDEAPARAKLRRLLAAESDVAVVGESANGAEAAEAIGALHPDLVLLDIQMPGVDGFGTIDRVGLDAMPYTVFVTAYDEHAVRAFEVNALDYLLKPVAPSRLRVAMGRVRAALDRGAWHEQPERMARAMEAVEAREPYLRRVLVQADNRALLLPVERIDRAVADRNYVHLHVAGGRFQLRTTISGLADRLDPAHFLRVNRAEVVRLDAIKELHPWFHGDYKIVLTDGTTVMWSRRFRAQQEKTFGL